MSSRDQPLKDRAQQFGIESDLQIEQSAFFDREVVASEEIAQDAREDRVGELAKTYSAFHTLIQTPAPKQSSVEEGRFRAHIGVSGKVLAPLFLRVAQHAEEKEREIVV
ncbi:MAG: hypothetical protein HY318_17055 [Armatimonadetes bacterium]|nr:hypothetical protein [Armatimonadota bacterium]